MKGRSRQGWRSAPVGQEFQPKTMLFEATVGMVDKMGGRNLKNASSFLLEGLRLPKTLDL